MGLRQQAESDLEFILEDADGGFGWPIVLTDPDGDVSTDLIGQSNDIAQMIDPETGQAVSGSSASVAIRISTLIAQGFTELPVGIVDSSILPWTVAFEDINGSPYVFKVIQSNPDRTVGIVVCVLEVFEATP